MSKSEEIREIVGWLNGFSAAVWLLPIDKVSDEYPAMYEEKIARLRKLLAEGGRGMIKFDTRPEIALSRDMWRKCADERRAERDQALQEAKELREELETAKAEYQRHRANLVECYAKKADESRRRGKAMHDMSQLIRERNEEIKSLKERVAEMEPRLMPQGYEWPRFEGGEPVMFGDETDITESVETITFNAGGTTFIGDKHGDFEIEHGESVKRPAVLAADGEPLEAGQTVWDEHGTEFTVKSVDHRLGKFTAILKYDECEYFGLNPIEFTHQRPVLDAEGNRIEPAMDVWWVCEGDERGIHAEKLHVESIGDDGFVACSPFNGGTWVELEPSELYVHKPVLDADGVPIKVGDTVYLLPGEWCGRFPFCGFHGGEELEVFADGEASHVPGGIQCREKEKRFGFRGTCYPQPSQLTHTKPEPPDSWEKVEEDAEKVAKLFDYFDADASDDMRAIVRRCKALAERGE